MSTGDYDEKERRRKRTSKVIRLSRDVFNFIGRKARKGESADSTLRRLFGLADRKGTPQDLRVYYVVPNDGKPIIRDTEADARGEAILLAARRRLGAKKAERVIEVREIPYVD